MSGIVSKIRGSVFHKFGKYFPKKFLVKYYYYRKTGRKIDLNNPKTISDKMGWYKLYYRDEIMRTCTDKAAVRDYLTKLGYQDILNECYGVYDRVEDINWDKLPNQFVLKNTLGGAMNGVYLVFNKDELDIKNTTKMLQKWIDLYTDYVSPASEWVYEGTKPRILIEKLLISDEAGDLPDYKFFCFNGKVFCSYFMRNCTTQKNRRDGELAILDTDYKLLPVRRSDFVQITEQPEKPKNYEKMLKLAEELSAPFPHVRVDLYNISGKIIFGELTFFTNSGVLDFYPESFEYEMGNAFILPEKNL